MVKTLHAFLSPAVINKKDSSGLGLILAGKIKNYLIQNGSEISDDSNINEPEKLCHFNKILHDYCSSIIVVQ